MSHIDTEVNSRNEAPTRAGTPAPPGDRVASSSPSVHAEISTLAGLPISSQLKQPDWANLKGLWETLSQAAAIGGLVPVKSIIEGLVELIVLYEDTAQNQNSQEYDDLRVHFECIFNELKHHISSSPVVTTSMDNICWSIQKEIEFAQGQQARLRNRKGEEVTDTNVVLECCRRIQGHLERLTRNANLSAWKIVDRLTTDNYLQKLSPSLWACYNSEKALELERRSCTKDTRAKVLEEMYQWVTAPDTGNIYWMIGMAGTGKTTIAYSLCEWLDAEPNRMLCASFFCSRALPECRDVGRIISSIAYQLARYSGPFQYALCQAMEKDPDAHTRLPHRQFDSLLVRPLSDMKVQGAFPTNMVVVIDALDECNDVKSTKLILDVLFTKSKDLPIKFVVSSRPEPVIRDQMEQNGTCVDARVVLHELDSGEVQSDIRTYLKAELAPIQPSESEIEQLVARAGVLFIYAATVVRYVGADNFKRNPRARLSTVLDMSKLQGRVQTREIDQLYGTILDAAAGDIDLEQAERDDMKLILDTAICACEPLTVENLNKLLGLNDVGRVHAALRPLWSVLHVMGPSMRVTTLHASFPDYLLDPQRSGVWHCDAKTHHELLTQRCFECIRDTKPQFNICHLKSSYFLDDEVEDLEERVQKFISTELRYSCQYWPSHLEATGSSMASDLVSLLSQFLTTHLLLWMEVRNLTKTLRATLGELTTAKRWVTQYNTTPHTIDLLTDAWRFASTPLRKHYHDRLHGLVRVKGTALKRRKGSLLAAWKLEFIVNCVACSPDGTRIAVRCETYGKYSRDCLYVLDAFTGSMLLDLSEGNQTKVCSIAFSPDSTHLVSGRADGYITIWDVANGQSTLRPFKANNDMVKSILYSHDGSCIVSVSISDKTIYLWDAVTGKPGPTPIVRYSEELTCIAISSDDTLLVSGSRDGAIRLRDIQSGQLVLDPMRGQNDEISAIAFSPDDSYIVSGSYDGTIILRDTKSGQMLYNPMKRRGRCVSSISISPDGASIASTSLADEVRIWDAVAGKSVSRLGPFSEKVKSHYLDSCFEWATYSHDGTRIIHIRDRTIRLLDSQAATEASNPPLGHNMAVISIDISPNGLHLVSGSYDSTLCLWDLNEGRVVLGPLHGHSDWVNMVRFSTDGSRIVSCAPDWTVRQWDAKSGAVYGMPIQASRSAVSATYSPDDTHIVSLHESGELWVWNSRNGRPVLGPVAALTRTFPVKAFFSPDGMAVIAGYDNGLIGAWDIRSGELVFSHQGDFVSPRSWRAPALALSPNGLCYAQGFSDGKISVRNVDTGQLMLEAFEYRTACIFAAQFSPDGTRLASGTKDGAVYVWDVNNGLCLSGPLRGHTDEVTSVVFSHKRKYVASASEDMIIRVWNVQPNKALVSKDIHFHTNLHLTHVLWSKNRNAVHADWVLNEDGWVVSGESQRLFWVPADLRNVLMRPSNKLILCREGYVRLKFEGARIGEAWVDCWRNG